MMRSWIALTISFLALGQGDAQSVLHPAAEVQAVASTALATFRDLVDEQNYQELGLQSPQEISALTLGRSLRVFWVPLDSLKNFKPGSNPDFLLKGGDEFIYPVVVENWPRASIVVQKVNEQWTATGFGGAKLARLLFKVQADSTFAVRVPALHLYFTAYHTAGVLMLGPLLDQPDLDLFAYQYRRAEQIFQALSSVVKPPPD